MFFKGHRKFFFTWLSKPLGVGAPIPSSRFLARAMAGEVDLSREGYVVELGGGTGIVTEELLNAGLPPERLAIIEREAGLHRFLKERFPKTLVVRGDAAQLSELLALHGISPVAAVVSSLPLLSMRLTLRERIVSEIAGLLDAGVPLIQYSYGLSSPVPRRMRTRLKLEVKPVMRIWRNFPPARVWRYTKADF